MYVNCMQGFGVAIDLYLSGGYQWAVCCSVSLSWS